MCVDEWDIETYMVQKQVSVHVWDIETYTMQRWMSVHISADVCVGGT